MDVELRIDGSRVAVEAPGWSGELRVPFPGAFNVENGLAALAFAVGWGVAPEIAAAAIGRAHAFPGACSAWMPASPSP